MSELSIKGEGCSSANLKEKKNSLAIAAICKEIEDHREELNDITSEIQSNYEYNRDLDRKITKLKEYVDEICAILSKMVGKKLTKSTTYTDIDPLTTKEKNIFLNLYTEEKPITYAELAKKMNMPILETRQYITNLLEKGVPVQKEYIKTLPFIYLDPKFKNLQAKKNILKIVQKILA